MPKFTRKPIEVDAVQFRMDMSIHLWPEKVDVCPKTGKPFVDGFADDEKIYLSDGDWILSLPHCTTAICDDEEFQANYEKVKE